MERVLSPPPTPQLLGECLRQRPGLDCVGRLSVQLVWSERLTFEPVDMLSNSRFHCLFRVTTLPLVLICRFVSAGTLSFVLVMGEAPFPALLCHTISNFTRLYQIFLCCLFYPTETTQVFTHHMEIALYFWLPFCPALCLFSFFLMPFQR